MAEITRSWEEHRQKGWPEPLPSPHRPEAEVEADYASTFVVCVLGVKVTV